MALLEINAMPVEQRISRPICTDITKVRCDPQAMTGTRLEHHLYKALNIENIKNG